MSEYVNINRVHDFPRIPLEGDIDLTYRCNNNCRHCWLRIPAGSPEKEKELTFDEIREIVKDARKMGCREWIISGGEPMLRPDFIDIFDHITSKAASYTINTNGTLITPKIARLLKRKGVKMVALCGATAEVHDQITRTPGSFDATIQGIAYLKEAGTDFTVQLVPMRDNYHQYKEMIRFAESLSRYWRIGAPWLYLSADGDSDRNREIMRQRLNPSDVVELDKPNMHFEGYLEKDESHGYFQLAGDDRLFASCITYGRKFQIDPYGYMSFCSFIKEPTLCYDLRKGSFKECWEEFIPSLADKIRGGQEYLENCASCDMRNDCRWCPVYGYLEHGRFSSKVDYLCGVVQENRRFKDNWQKNHRRYYQIAGITIQVDSDLPITEGTFSPKFKPFEVNGPGEDTIKIVHHFSLPYLQGIDLGQEVYRHPPWAIYKKANSWIYLGVSPTTGDKRFHLVAVFNNDYNGAMIYSPDEEAFRKGGLPSLTLFPTDQILLARTLAYREGCYLHSSGVVFEGNGFLFVGHSDAGKSTIVKMLKDRAEILCDDRIIVRRWAGGFKIHGTWSHGEVPDVSAGEAPLKGIFFLEKANKNQLRLFEDSSEMTRRLLACLIKALVTADWWEKMLSLVERIVVEVPCYSLQFNKSGGVVEILEKAFRKEP